MTALEWILALVLFSIYITCVFTVCSLTFQKGYTLFGIIGIFFPILWLIGAFMPAKQGSRFDIAQQTRYQSQKQQYTQ